MCLICNLYPVLNIILENHIDIKDILFFGLLLLFLRKTISKIATIKAR